MKNCRQCGAPNKVQDSRRATVDPEVGSLKSLTTVWRRRECPNGHRIDTIEVPVGTRLRYRVHPDWPVSGPREGSV